MKTTVRYAVAVAIGLAILIAIGVASDGAGETSTYSSFDTGPNGYAAVYGVLARERVDVGRLMLPLGQLDPRTRVLVITSTALDGPLERAPKGNDLKRLQAFARGGGRVVYFSALPRARTHTFAAAIGRGVVILPVKDFTNNALSQHPERMQRVYDAIAGRGPVAFDEEIHGYGTERSLWSVLPGPVRAAFWIAIVAFALVVIDANVRSAPALRRDPPLERDSSAYIRSMAALLRRVRARTTAIARFAKNVPGDADLARLARVERPTDAMLLRAAALYHLNRKDHP